MAKVGIVTFHSAHNFGAVLQCLALKTVLTKLGHDVSVIDYRNPKIERAYTLRKPMPANLNWLQKSKWCVSFLLTCYARKRRIEKFKAFIKSCLSPVSQRDCPIGDYDIVIWGSDQIWRYDLTDGDDYYFGQVGNVKKKLAYGASAGIIDSLLDKKVEYIKNFSAVGVREVHLKKYLEDNGIEAEVNIDPTLLLDKKEWTKLLSIKQIKPKSYICIYAMRNRAKVLEKAYEISALEKIPVVEIMNNNISPRLIFKAYCAGSPLDFVSLIKNAKFVVTDSFHGTAFSIIMQKPFITVKLNDGHDGRSEALLKSLGLESRLSEDIKGYNEIIDYSNIENNLKLLRDSSLNFLRKNLD